MELFGSIFIIIFGCLGHFIFEWSGHKHLAGLLFAVNESTWEHIKLTIYPSFIWMFVELHEKGLSETLFIAQFASMATMILLVPCLFYGYTAITKKNWLISDILCFVIAVVAGQKVFSLVYQTETCNMYLMLLSIFGLTAILVAYLRFSYDPPRNFLFKDPVSGCFGPDGHECEAHFHSHKASTGHKHSKRSHHHHHNRKDIY